MMSYIYVLPMANYVKFGVTKNPLKRLDQHIKEIGQPLEYSKLWKCSEEKYKRIESTVKLYLADLPQETRERIFADEGVIIDAILKAVKFYDAEIEETAIDDAIALNCKTHLVPVMMTPSQVEKLDQVRAQMEGVPSRSEAMRRLIDERHAELFGTS